MTRKTKKGVVARSLRHEDDRAVQQSHSLHKIIVALIVGTQLPAGAPTVTGHDNVMALRVTVSVSEAMVRPKW